MITLTTAGTIAGKAGTNSAITCTIQGDAVGVSDSFTTLYQGVLTTSATTLYTVPASTQALIKQIHLANTTGSDVTGVVFYTGGTAGTNQITGTITVPANGTATFDGTWTVYNNAGAQITSVLDVADNSITNAKMADNAINTAEIADNAVGNPELADMATETVKGRAIGAGTGDPVDLSRTQLTALNNLATTSLPGNMSAADKSKLDNTWYDVTNYGLVGNDSTDNASAWSTLFSLLPTGATVYFPPGTYRTTAEFAISADKHLKIIGAGRYASIIKNMTAGANTFNINGAYWYNTFERLGFTAGVTKTAGAAINISPGSTGASISIDINDCAFNGQFIAIYALSAGAGGQAANASIWQNLEISAAPVNGRGIKIDAPVANLAIVNSIINLGYPPFQVAGTCCIEINQAGAVQILGCEVIGGTNTLWLNGSSGGSTSVAAVYCTNTFFDQSAGSTVKISGANIVNRCKFVQCGITTGNIASGIAVEIASAGTGAAGTATAAADGINFIDCDLYPNSGSGTINGFQITGAQGVSIQSSRISGFTNGIAVTPVATAGYTKISITDNKLGATNNFTTPNTVGVLLNASANYGVMTITGNDFTGSTTPITDGNTSTAQKQIDSNVGLPLGAVKTTQVAAIGATEVLILNAPVPANSLRVGTTFKITGYFNRATSDANVTTLRAKFGTAGTIADGNVVALAVTQTAVANQGGRFEMLVTCRAIGAGATSLTGSGHAILFTNAGNAAPASSTGVGLGTALGALTSSNAMFIGVSAQHATANTLTVDNCVIEVLQQ